MFCSFARLETRRASGGYTMSLEEAVEKLLRAARRWASPRSTSSTACTPACRSTTTPSCSRGSRQAWPELHLKAFTAVEILYFAEKFGMTIEAGAARAAGGRPRLAARRRRRDLRPARAPEDLRRQGDRRRVARGSPHRPPDGAALELHHALRPHRDGSRSASITCCGCARCRTRPAASRPSSRWPFTPTTTRSGSLPRPTGVRRPAHLRGRAAAAQQHPPRQGVLDHAGRARLRRPRSGSAPTISTAPCRKSASTTWPARRRRR